MTKHLKSIVCAFVLVIIGCIALPAWAAEINPKDYGATGNGTTDDQVALEKAFAAANSSPNSTVRFPSGAYLHSGELVGTNGTDVVAAPKATVSLIASTANAALHLSGGSTSVENVIFGSKSGGGTAIIFDKNTARFTARSVVIVEGFAIGIRALSGKNGTIRSCEVDIKPNGTGLRCESCNTVSLVNNRWVGQVHNTNTNKNINATVFTGCENVSITGDNFRFADLGVTVVSSRTFNLGACNFDPCFFGIHAVSVTDLVASNSTFEGLSHLNGLALETTSCRRVTFDENQIGNMQKVCQASGDSNVQINGNKIANVAGGITVIDAEDVNVNANEIASSDSFGISLQFDQGKIECFRNDIQNCGLGALPTLAVIDANCPLTPSMSITDNRYSGNAKGLSFYIRCFQRSPQAKLQGNTTTTLLPSKQGL